ncbi:uncharacterized protein LOC109538995 [Dendroctonus ponderosae]|uniref:Uncharacterized protein n=1 Tax=Dendroctonus ponderosae TaxID=77166 RepID=U4UKF4_DENPD|nr:uncharacterized protein LOC109538995 [Dendroctonus ponderosae]ERL90661.1 hypothetical protein D910_08008 [Dendroctonus ponderosae]
MRGRNRNLDSPDKDALSDSSDLPSFRESLRTGIRCPSLKANKPDAKIETDEEGSAPEANEGVVSQPEARARRSAKLSCSYLEKKDNDSTIKRNSKQNSKKPVKRRLRKSVSSKKRKSDISVAVGTSDREQEVRNRLNEVRRKAEPLLNEIDNFEELQASNQYNYIEKSLMKLEEILDRMSEDIKKSTQLVSETKEVYSYIRDIYAKLDQKLKANQTRLGDIEMTE